MLTNQQNPIYMYMYIYCLEHYMYMEEEGRTVDLIALFHISNVLATFFIFR